MDISHIPVERLREPMPRWAGDIIRQQRAEIERLEELLRGTGASRYWEGRWRDEVARIERLQAVETAARTFLNEQTDQNAAALGAALARKKG